MPDYKNSKIYKLWSPQGDDIYIGATVNSLAKRKGEHKKHYNNGINVSSKILFEKYDDVRIELIEKFPCENKMELNKREGHYIRTLECVNKHIAGRTRKEWVEDNKEKRTERHKEYYEKNKEKIKEYSEDNREKIKEYKKQYHEKNKEYLNQKKRELYAKKKNLVSVQSVVLSPPHSVE
jgi:hypothetical protein